MSELVATATEIAAARAVAPEGEVEVDDVAPVSWAEDALWVQGVGPRTAVPLARVIRVGSKPGISDIRSVIVAAVSLGHARERFASGEETGGYTVDKSRFVRKAKAAEVGSIDGSMASWIQDVVLQDSEMELAS